MKATDEQIVIRSIREVLAVVDWEDAKDWLDALQTIKRLVRKPNIKPPAGGKGKG